MNQDDVQGAIAAAQYFLELYPYAYNTGDLTEWREMSHPECIFCASVIENVEALHASGGYEVGGEFVFETVSARDPLPDNDYFAVDFEVVQQEIRELDKSGHLAKVTPEADFSIFTAVLRSEDDWMIRAVSTEEGQ